ncbi:ATP-binding protein [Amnibacterium sp.]|uniref:sensor histidine kinase n=1 Tax=Amnibacterium sp. TaxID=1872496 RepID=UPI00260FE8F1|nr:ATP-binding protein [Amnibacterium sp.]MCU1474848.1 ATP-binding protein [Amnibacterium sp.]
MSTAADGAQGAGPALPRQIRLLSPLADRTGEERVLRVTAFGFMPASVVFGVLALPDLHAQMGDYPLWWVLAVVTGVLVAPVVMGLLAFAVPLRALSVLASVSAATALLAQVTLPIANDGTLVPDAGAPWIDDFVSLGAIVSVLAVRPVWTALIAFSTSCLTVVDRWAVTPGHDLLPGVQNGLYVFLFCITFIALGVMTFHGVRAADLAEAAALEAAANAAADAAREREQGRINALVHDRVLATLLAAARPVPGSEALRRADAARALDGLRALLSDSEDLGGDLDGEAFAWSLQATTTELAPEAVFGYEVHSDLRIQPAAVEALTAAAEEALRNSVLHASAANRTVHVHVGEDGAQVDVLDDGVGFDPSRVPPTRLGISESIRGRMEALPGGSAVVVSTPGIGTRVQLRFRPDGDR